MTTQPRSALLAFILLGLQGCGDAGSAAGPVDPGRTQPTSAGSPSAGGSTAGAGSGAASSGGTFQSGGAAAAGAPSSPGGASASGGSASGGSSALAGAGGSAAGSGGSAGMLTVPPTGGTIPAGYPTPTASNLAQCKSVQPSGGFCPGGGVGPACLECLFGGQAFNTSTTATAQATMEAGNYLVTVQLGAAAGQTYVSAESNRGLLAPVTTTTAGPALQYGFVVNVRANEGQPLQAVAAGYPGLDLFFSGPTAPPVTAIGFSLVSAATKPIMVYMAGDSTVCDQDTLAFGGWGQMIPQFFAPPIGVANYADSGESSTSFYGSAKLWGAIKSHWVAGDWVIIQFGHNDKGVPDATVQANLERYATEALAANVTPIIVSPPARVEFVGSVEGDQSGLHPAAAKAAAAAKKVAFVDLTALSIAWYNSLGSTAAALKFHANGMDPTHTNLAGALQIATLVASDIKRQNLGLAKYMRP